MRYLITGVAGHIGSQLAMHIKREEPSAFVAGIDDCSSGYYENVPKHVEFWKGSADTKSIIDYSRVDVVYHLAAYAAECMSPFCRRYNYQNNLAVTSGLVSNLIDSGFKGRLVFTSSVAVYGAQEPPFDENTRPRPHDPYGVAKLACELDIKIAGEQHGLDWCIVRPRNVYGPGQSLWQRWRNVVGLWMRAAIEHQSLVMFGDGEQTRAFTPIRDVLNPLLAAGSSTNASRRVINLGSSKPVSLNDLHEALCAIVGEDLEIRREPARHEAKHAWCDTKRSEELLDYRDATSLIDGLKEMWTWARAAWEQYPERREIPARPRITDVDTFVGMPQSWLNQLQVAD